MNISRNLYQSKKVCLNSMFCKIWIWTDAMLFHRFDSHYYVNVKLYIWKLFCEKSMSDFNFRRPKSRKLIYNGNLATCCCLSSNKIDSSMNAQCYRIVNLRNLRRGKQGIPLEILCFKEILSLKITILAIFIFNKPENPFQTMTSQNN